MAVVTKNGFCEDQATQRFCAVLILSAIDEARQRADQTAQDLSEEQLHARHFLIAPDNRAMLTQLVEGMGVAPDWFFGRVLKRLVQQRWPPVPEAYRQSSRVHGSGLYIFFEESEADRLSLT